MNITNADQEQTLGCIQGKESLLISPIIHWTEQDVWEFLNKVMEVPHCSLYDEGWRRLGCIGCPMSSAKQKQIENVRYPHVKKNWIKAIKAIRGGAILRAKQSASTNRIIQQAPVHQREPTTECGTSGFSQSSSSDRLTDEQMEDLIAENIYDWWISGKSYKKWYTDKFLQLKFEFPEDNETQTSKENNGVV